MAIQMRETSSTLVCQDAAPWRRACMSRRQALARQPLLATHDTSLSTELETQFDINKR